MNIINEWTVYTDGSTNNNGRENAVGGIGIFFKTESQDNLSLKLNLDTVTNNICELEACVRAINIITLKKKFNKKDKIIIGTDSKYVINSIVQWFPSWEKNNWKNSKNEPVKNLNIIKKLRNYYLKYNIVFKYIKAHQRKPSDIESEEYQDWFGNNQADLLAKNSYIT